MTDPDWAEIEKACAFADRNIGTRPRFTKAAERLRSRLQATEARADEAARGTRIAAERHVAQLPVTQSLAACSMALERAQASLARVQGLCDDIDQGEHAIHGSGSMDFGRGMAHASKQFRAAVGVVNPNQPDDKDASNE